MTKDTAHLRIGDFNVKVEYTGRWENDGIGWYDYWGHVQFDKGRDYFMVEEINPIFTDEDPDEIIRIVGLINDNFYEYAEAIAELQE